MSKNSKYTGLNDAEVLESRRIHGANVLSPAKKDPVWKQFLLKFTDPLIIVLMVAGMLSIGISFYNYSVLGHGVSVFFEPIGIFVAVMLATGLAFIFELKADREFELLNKVNDDEPVLVVRNGAPGQVPRRDIVVGDIVRLDTGDDIPADGDLLEATTLSVDESSLTGEPLCHKSADPADADKDATFPTDHVLRGTKVMEGHAVMLVTAVGDHTENGRVLEATQIDTSVKTPLNEQLDRFGKLISKIAFVLGAVIIAGRLTIYLSTCSYAPFDVFALVSYLLDTFMIAVALIVVAVPEGLPMAVTLSLAYSMRRMLRTSNLVRKLHACETMGATTVICTDKTGTLTQNRMQVYRTNFFGNPPSEVIEEGIAVNSTAQLDLSGERPEVLGNPTEGALLLWLRERGIDYTGLRESARVVAELPFSTERKYMATVVDSPSGRRILYVKGAPEIVFSMCASAEGVTKAELDAILLEYQNMAMRTLGFAWQILDNSDAGVISDGRVVTDGLVFMGIAAISDPVRADVPDAVREVLDAGIGVKIVTGDTPGTAKEIGRQVGLWDDAIDGDANITTGPEFASWTDEEVRSRVGTLKIIARARPLDKKRLVEALQAGGDVVAVTGDGTNDAPALKAAHVGLSMGDGTSVAKEASDITIIDNSFASIGRAVMWGRSLYRNIRRFVMFQLTVNVCASLVVIFGAFSGFESPLTVTQMLWVNLIMDTLAAVALASLPPSVAVMREKPRSRSEFIISPAMRRYILGWGVGLFAVLLGVLLYFEHTELTAVSRFGRLPFVAAHDFSPVELSIFFTIFVYLQFWNLFNVKAFKSSVSAFNLKGCEGFVLIAGIVAVGQLLIVQFGGEFFNVVPLSLSDWLLIILCTSPVALSGELIRRKG